MHLGMVGLGRMGGNMVTRLRQGGHQVTGYDANPAVSDVPSLAGLVAALTAPRTVWVMVPAGAPTDDTLAQLIGLLEPGDLLIDGGNTYFRDSLKHAEAATAAGVWFSDASTSGGIWA